MACCNFACRPASSCGCACPHRRDPPPSWLHRAQAWLPKSQACFLKINRTYKQHCAGATTFSETTLQQDLVLCCDFYVSSGLRYLWRPVAVKTVTAPNLVAKAGAMSSELPSSRCSPGALLRMQLNLQICSIVSKTRFRFRFTDNNMDELFSVGRHIFQRNVT